MISSLKRRFDWPLLFALAALTALSALLSRRYTLDDLVVADLDLIVLLLSPLLVLSGIIAVRLYTRQFQRDRDSTALAVLKQIAGGCHASLLDWYVDHQVLTWFEPHRNHDRDFHSERLTVPVDSLIARLHPDDHAALTTLTTIPIADERTAIPYDFSVRVRDEKDWTPLRIIGCLYRDQAKGLRRFSALAIHEVDSSPRSHHLSALDTPLRNAIECLAESFVLWDKDNRLISCNSHYRRLFGLKEAYAQPGMSYDDVIARAGVPAIRRRTLLQEGEGAGVSEIEFEDNRWLHVSERRTNDGGFLSVGHDITDLKQQQQTLLERERMHHQLIGDLQNAHKKLEYKQRQLVALNERNAVAKNRAEAASRSKSTFLANMNHELRTPLNIIIGFSELMKDRLFGPLGDPHYESYANDIWHSGKYLLELVDRVLELSQAEGGRWPLRRVSIPIEPLFSECLRIASASCSGKILSFKTNIEPNCEAFGDRLALKQILLNLLSNSIKFTESTGRITLVSKRRGDVIAIAVIDTGIGIAEAIIPNLGRPFEIVDDQPQIASSHAGGNSGIGLALARSFVEMHGGKLNIDSRKGEGTEVSFTIAAAQSQSASAVATG